MPASFVVAEMNTAHFIFKGAGVDRITARNALLAAWGRHRTELLQCYPERASSLPEPEQMERHFPIYYFDYELNAGYRDSERLR